MVITRWGEKWKIFWNDRGGDQVCLVAKEDLVSIVVVAGVLLTVSLVLLIVLVVASSGLQNSGPLLMLGPTDFVPSTIMSNLKPYLSGQQLRISIWYSSVVSFSQNGQFCVWKKHLPAVSSSSNMNTDVTLNTPSASEGIQRYSRRMLPQYTPIHLSIAE